MISEKRIVPMKPRSTFRRIGARNSQPPTPSPLRSHLTTTSTSFRTLSPGSASVLGFESSAQAPPSDSGVFRSLLTNVHPTDLRSDSNGSDQSSSLAVPPSPRPLSSVSPSPKPLDAPLPQMLPTSTPSPPPAMVASTPPSTTSLVPAEPKLAIRVKTPYRPGFQPKGVYRHLTEEFCALRDSGTNQRKSEERRIERRLEKVSS